MGLGRLGIGSRRRGKGDICELEKFGWKLFEIEIRIIRYLAMLLFKVGWR